MHFFLLSGFLIAHTLMTKSNDPDYGFRDYAIDRIARIYSGWVPALIFVAIADSVLVEAGVYDGSRAHDLGTFVSNLFMLQGYPGVFASHLAVSIWLGWAVLDAID
jgi:peptidoglycan/LPS O-acetylase OafA/YrhL